MSDEELKVLNKLIELAIESATDGNYIVSEGYIAQIGQGIYDSYSAEGAIYGETETGLMRWLQEKSLSDDNKLMIWIH